ncbi:hypothetical protein BDV93DRAFT_411265, partial [Ceratobasidium sp. AG-I]
LKFKSVYLVKTRQLARKLVLAGVASSRVRDVIQICAEGFDLDVKNIPSARSIGRFVLEGGVGASIQVSNALAQAQGLTISMDSTSQRSVNYSSMHIMANTGNAHQLLFLAVESTVNHSSQTQVDVLKNTLAQICDTAQRAPNVADSPMEVLTTNDIARKIYGASGDHANDQIKVAALEKDWKLNSWFEYLGNEHLLQLSSDSAAEFLRSVRTAAEVSLGYNQLSVDAQTALIDLQKAKQIRMLGEAAFLKLPAEEQKDIGFFVRFGCCMHKDLNTIKGGVSALQKYWKATSDYPRPVLLPNKDNEAVLALASSNRPPNAAEQRAVSLSDSGAIKLCSLAGAWFNNKDDKLGAQDEYLYYFQLKHGTMSRFPDTSNVRYGSYIDAATQLFTHRQHHLDFISYWRDKKRSGTLNHLEQNVLKALSDDPTVAELAVLAAYGQAISKPYMQLVRLATLAGKSIAELAGLHCEVKALLQTIAANPQILLKGDISVKLDSMVIKEWSDPQVFDELAKNSAKMPYLPALLSEFCNGALETWDRFSQDIIPGGIPISLSPEEMMKSFSPPTNDSNEGALGTWRVWLRQFPCLTTHRFNAIIANRMNKTEDYMESNFTPDTYTWIRQEARRIDSSKLEQKRKLHLLETAEQEARQNAVAHAARAERKAEKIAHVQGIELELDMSQIVLLKGPALTDQLKAHR